MESQVTHFGEYAYHPEQLLLQGKRSSVKLEPKIARLLEVFLSHPNETLTRDDLTRLVWASAFVSDDAINHSISKLRSLLNPEDKHAYITTIPKVGYRFEPANVASEEALIQPRWPGVKFVVVIPFAVGLMLLAWWALLPQPQSSPSADNRFALPSQAVQSAWYMQARNDFQAKENLTEALARLAKITQEFPEFPEAMALNAGIYWWLGEQGTLPQSEAAQAVKKIAHRLELSYPNHPVLYSLRGRICEVEGKPKEAELFYQRAIGLAPDNADYHAKLALLLADWQPERAEPVIQQGRAIAPLNARLIVAQLSVLAYRGEMQSARELFLTSLSLVESPELVFRRMLALEIAQGAHAHALALIETHASLIAHALPEILDYLSSLGFDAVTHPLWSQLEARSAGNMGVHLGYLTHLLVRLEWEVLLPELDAMAVGHHVQTPNKWHGKDYWIAFRYCYLNWHAGRLEVAQPVCEQVSRAAIDAPGVVDGATKLLLATRATYHLPFTPEEVAQLRAAIARFRAKPVLSPQDNFELAQWYALNGQMAEAMDAVRDSSLQGVIVPAYQFGLLDRLKISQQPAYPEIQTRLTQNAERLQEENAHRLSAIQGLLSQALGSAE